MIAFSMKLLIASIYTFISNPANTPFLIKCLLYSGIGAYSTIRFFFLPTGLNVPFILLSFIYLSSAFPPYVVSWFSCKFTSYWYKIPTIEASTQTCHLLTLEKGTGTIINTNTIEIQVSPETKSIEVQVQMLENTKPNLSSVQIDQNISDNFIPKLTSSKASITTRDQSLSLTTQKQEI